MSRYKVISGPYFPVFGLNTKIYGVFSPNTGKYGPEITPYLETFHTVAILRPKAFIFTKELHLIRLTGFQIRLLHDKNICLYISIYIAGHKNSDTELFITLHMQLKSDLKGIERYHFCDTC